MLWVGGEMGARLYWIDVAPELLPEMRERKALRRHMSIAACMDKCLESDKSDCGGVTVAWTEDGNGTVECYLRSNIDIGSCEDGQKDKQWYSTFTRD